MTLTIDRAKARAKLLRTAMADLNFDLSHGQALDVLAKLEGLKDWNTLSARLDPDVPIGPLPEGWMRSGNRPERFEMGRAKRDGEQVAAIRLKAGEEHGDAFGTLMQTIKANDFRGKRVALSAQIASDDVSGGVTIWMRADDAGKQAVAFDNLESAPVGEGTITGTSDWVQRSVVLDIPDTAETLNFGFYLRGGGTAWCRNVSVAEADEPVTKANRVPGDAPQNLSFAG